VYGPFLAAPRSAATPSSMGRPAPWSSSATVSRHPGVTGRHDFRILASNQRPEFDVQTLAQPTHDAILQPWADTSAQVRGTST